MEISGFVLSLSLLLAMYFPILTRVENGRFHSSKTGDVVVKNDDLDLNFQGQHQFYANFLFYILII